MNKILDNIDKYFEQKSQSESTILTYGVGLIIVAFVYFLLFDISAEYFEEHNNHYTDIEARLVNTNHYLKMVSSADGLDTNYAINAQTNILNGLRLKLDGINKQNEYFDTKLKELSFLLFNEQNWAKFLDDLVVLAQRNDITIQSISNEFKEPTIQKVEQFLNINIKANGDFKDLVSYIDAIEKSKLVVDLNRLDINSSSNKLNSDIGIAVWGIKY
ncbi:hypothetical protein LMG7974_00055 [Campylobacter majalis]|uniref:Uncharacterized protein n=1 Tax=Campylobacter majalis TaxID=2790656 RepID=A0ABM8Q1U5_9BACT|nr:type 4a pilus biogenesis protein PilO [Campylobacter majalis]CAD7286730.1 hypothetical protein LMG7974_00055 [Campylobacter majalis]